MTSTILSTPRVVQRLLEAGMPAAQAYAFVRLLADVRHDGFDRAIAHRDLVAAGFTEEQSAILIEETVLALRPQDDQLSGRQR